MNIVHITNFLIPGHGYQEEMLSRHQARAGHRVTIVASNLAYPDVGYYKMLANTYPQRTLAAGVTEEDGYRVARLPVRFESGWRVWMAGLERVLYDAAPDLVVAHAIPHFGTIRAAAFKLSHLRRFTFVADDHHHWNVYEGGRRREAFFRAFRATLTPLLNRTVSRYIGVTGETAELMATLYGIDRARIEVIPLGVDLDSFRRETAAGAEVRAGLGFAPDDVVVIYAGKVMRDTRRVDLLLEAAIPLMKARPGMRLLFVGPPEPADVAWLEAETARAGLDGRVVVRPSVPKGELHRWYSAADVAVWPYGISITCLEASACGLPILLEDIPINRERTAFGNGLVFSGPDDLRAKLATLVDDAGLRARMRAAAEDRIPAVFSWGAIAARFTAMAETL